MYVSSKIMLFTKMLCIPANPSQFFFSILNVFEGVLITWMC